LGGWRGWGGVMWVDGVVVGDDYVQLCTKG
jgi:hypothetical protein